MFVLECGKGELVEISEIARAYQSAVDHPASNGQIYFRPIRAVGENVQNVVKRHLLLCHSSDFFRSRVLLQRHRLRTRLPRCN